MEYPELGHERELSRSIAVRSVSRVRGPSSRLATWADLAFAALGLALGAASLYAPPGRDQGVFLYVGREWLNGRLPYRDTFDMKPPAIHALYALSLALSGGETWGIRVLDLVAVLMVGVSAALLANRTPRPGAAGAAIWTASLFYFGFFDFWNTAQCEIWCATFSLVSLCATARVRRAWLAAALGGALLMIAALFKPPALLVAPIGVAVLWYRERSRPDSVWHRLALVAAFVTSGTMVGVGVAAYFAAHDALQPMVRDLSNNPYYVSHGALVHSWSDVGERMALASRVFGLFLVLLPLVLAVACAITARMGNGRQALRYAMPIALLALAVCGVAVQRKFYWYHWGLLVGPVVLGVAVLADHLATVLERTMTRRRWIPSLVTVASVSLLFAASGSAALNKETSLWGMMNGAARRASGALSPEQYAERFDFQGAFSYSVPTSARIASWLRANSSLSDGICVRGHEAQIYALAGRRCPGRFFWTTFLGLEEWSPPATRQAWLDEERTTFERSPPRFVVVPTCIHAGPDAEQSFLQIGYKRRVLIDGWAILERAPPPTGDRISKRTSREIMRHVSEP